MAEMFMRNQQRSHRPNGPQMMPFASPGMMNYFAPQPQPYMMAPQMYSGMMPNMFMMSPMMPMMNPMMPSMGFGMMQPSYAPLQPFNQFGGSSFNSGFTPQQPFYGQRVVQQPPMQPYQPPVQPVQPVQPRPIVQQPTFIPPQSNVSGFGQPQNQYPPLGFQANQPQGGFGQPQGGFGQPQGGFGQPQGGFGQPQGGFQPPGFGQQPPGFGQPFNPFSNM
jgi:hypothetical protein